MSARSSEKDAWVAVSGTATAVHNRAKMEALWSPVLGSWCPDPLDDPNSAVLNMSVAQAGYPETGPSKAVQRTGFLTVIASKKEFELGENVKPILAQA